MFINKLKSFSILMLCLVANIAFADTTLPEHYPASFEASGTVTNIDREKKIIWLDGAQYKLHPLHDIYTESRGSSILLYSLKKGMKVGGEFSTFKNQKAFTKLWVVPNQFPTMIMDV